MLASRGACFWVAMLFGTAVTLGTGQAVASVPNLCQFTEGAPAYDELSDIPECADLLQSGGAGDTCGCLDAIDYDTAYWSEMRCILSETNSDSITANWLQCRSRHFCEDYAETCADQEPYPAACGSDAWHSAFDPAVWLVSGSTTPSNTLSCRTTQLMRARNNPVQREHSCFAASPSGGDVCIEVSAIPAGSSRSGLVLSDERMKKSKAVKADSAERVHSPEGSAKSGKKHAKHSKPSKHHGDGKKAKHSKKEKKGKGKHDGKKGAKLNWKHSIFPQNPLAWSSQLSVLGVVAAAVAGVFVAVKAKRANAELEYVVGIPAASSLSSGEQMKLTSPSRTKASYHAASRRLSSDGEPPAAIDDWPDDYLVPACPVEDASPTLRGSAPSSGARTTTSEF